MKLSKIVHYRNLLQQYNVEQIHFDASMRLAEILHTAQNNEVKFDFVGDDLAHNFSNIASGFDQFGQTLKTLIDNLNREIEDRGKAYFVESYRMYDEEMRKESTDWILNRRMALSDETKDILVGRIQSYSNWKYPGLIIRPGLEDFIKYMVSFSPLYIVDLEHQLLAPAIKQFPIEYQRRLRSYRIKEEIDQPILDSLPDGQFGICLAFNFFDFKPIEIIKKYINELYVKMKPGGIVLMTYNDCDRAHNVALVENHFTCYTPGTLIKSLASIAGFETIYNWTDGGNLNWLELRKPGELTSIRGGQTLAKIIPK